MEQYSQQECIVIAEIHSRNTNNFLDEHVLLIFSTIGVNIDELDIVAYRRFDSTDRTIVIGRML